MSLSADRGDREYGKFRDTGSQATSKVAVTIEGALAAPDGTDAIVVGYPSSTVETYAFKSGGTGGTTLMTLTVTYTTSSKEVISTVVRT